MPVRRYVLRDLVAEITSLHTEQAEDIRLYKSRRITPDDYFARVSANGDRLAHLEWLITSGDFLPDIE